jgi:hypothetical protein
MKRKCRQPSRRSSSLLIACATAAHPRLPRECGTPQTWCSDFLSALVLRINGNTKTGVKSTLAMQKIERTEPDPALFQIPEGYAVTESVAEPRKRVTPNPAPTVQP